MSQVFGVNMTKPAEAERLYRDLFHNVPIGLCVQDFSEVKKLVDEVRERGVRDWRDYFAGNPDFVRRCALAVGVMDVNEVVLRQIGVASPEEFGRILNQNLAAGTLDAFSEELASLAEGQLEQDDTRPARRSDGSEIWLSWRLRVAPGCEDSWARVLVSTVDITRQKRAEEGLETRTRLLQTLAEFEELAGA